MGTPIGSILLGKKDFIKKARRIRKVLGGGMRQAGYLAAAGIFALENNIGQLANDHLHAKMLRDALNKKDFVKNIFPVESNIIIFEVGGRMNARQLAETLALHKIRVIDISATQVRMVLHLDVSAAMVQQAIEVIDQL